MIEFEKVQYILDSVGKEMARASLGYVNEEQTYSVLTALNRLGYLQWPPDKENVEVCICKTPEYLAEITRSICTKCNKPIGPVGI